MGQQQQIRIGAASAEVFDDFMTPSRSKALFGGRGSAKSHFFAESMVANAAKNSGFRAVCIREVQRALKDSAKLLIEDKIRALGYAKSFGVMHDQIITPGGGVIIFQGMQDHTAESIKSLEGFNVAWVEEAQTLSAKSLELLRPTIRAAGSELWFSWNPRSASDPVDKYFRGLNPPKNSIVRRINYHQNKFFPAELEAERLDDKRNNPDRYAHIWLGEYEPQAVGSIWSRQVIHEGRRDTMPCERERTLVGVDPAITDTERSDEHGITVCAIGEDQRGYLLEDGSTRGPPHQWATRAVALYDKWDADAIVIERNQGGDMCRYTLETIRRGIRIIEVVATRGKHVRAEPISALYTLGKISHVGTYPELEDQLCRFTGHGYEGADSPDRAEAMIWCMTELFPALTVEKPAPVEMYHAQAGGWMA
jgi:phage terminase large subunit-like protein